MSRMVFERAALAFLRSIRRTKLPIYVPTVRTSILFCGFRQNFCRQVLLSSITVFRSQLLFALTTSFQRQHRGCEQALKQCEEASWNRTRRHQTNTVVPP